MRQVLFLHPYYVKYHIQCSLWLLAFDKISLIWQNWIEKDSKTKLQVVFNYIVTGLTHQVIVLHVYHLKFLYAYYKLVLKMCTSLNYVHNAHCNFLKIQTVSMQETTIWMVQSSYFSVQRAVSFWDIHNTMRKTPARSFQSTFFLQQISFQCQTVTCQRCMRKSKLY